MLSRINSSRRINKIYISFASASEDRPDVTETYTRAKVAQPEYLALQTQIKQLRVQLAATRRNRSASTSLRRPAPARHTAAR